MDNSLAGLFLSRLKWKVMLVDYSCLGLFKINWIVDQFHCIKIKECHYFYAMLNFWTCLIWNNALPVKNGLKLPTKSTKLTKIKNFRKGERFTKIAYYYSSL